MKAGKKEQIGGSLENPQTRWEPNHPSPHHQYQYQRYISSQISFAITTNIYINITIYQYHHQYLYQYHHNHQYLYQYYHHHSQYLTHQGDIEPGEQIQPRYFQTFQHFNLHLHHHHHNRHL